MNPSRFEERKAELERATIRLQESLQRPQDDLTRDAVIQRFEFTCELLWETLKLYLERQGREAGGPRQTLKAAFAEGLIKTPEEADAWFQMLDDRNLTSHTYQEELAIRIHEEIRTHYAAMLQGMLSQIKNLRWN